VLHYSDSYFNVIINLISLTGFNTIQYDYALHLVVDYIFGPPCILANEGVCEITHGSQMTWHKRCNRER